MPLTSDSQVTALRREARGCDAECGLASSLEALNRKAQSKGLTDVEERERDELLHVYEKSMVVRSAVLAELHKRGIDVSKLITP